MDAFDIIEGDKGLHATNITAQAEVDTDASITNIDTGGTSSTETASSPLETTA